MAKVPIRDEVRKHPHNHRASLTTVPTNPLRNRIRNCFRLGNSNGSTWEKLTRRSNGHMSRKTHSPTKPEGKYLLIKRLLWIRINVTHQRRVECWPSPPCHSSSWPAPDTPHRRMHSWSPSQFPWRSYCPLYWFPSTRSKGRLRCWRTQQGIWTRWIDLQLWMEIWQLSTGWRG